MDNKNPRRTLHKTGPQDGFSRNPALEEAGKQIIHSVSPAQRLATLQSAQQQNTQPQVKIDLANDIGVSNFQKSPKTSSGQTTKTVAQMLPQQTQLSSEYKSAEKERANSLAMQSPSITVGTLEQRKKQESQIAALNLGRQSLDSEKSPGIYLNKMTSLGSLSASSHNEGNSNRANMNIFFPSGALQTPTAHNDPISIVQQASSTPVNFNNNNTLMMQSASSFNISSKLGQPAIIISGSNMQHTTGEQTPKTSKLSGIEKYRITSPMNKKETEEAAQEHQELLRKITQAKERIKARNDRLSIKLPDQNSQAPRKSDTQSISGRVLMNQGSQKGGFSVTSSYNGGNTNKEGDKVNQPVGYQSLYGSLAPGPGKPIAEAMAQQLNAGQPEIKRKSNIDITFPQDQFMFKKDSGSPSGSPNNAAALLVNQTPEVERILRVKNFFQEASQNNSMLPPPTKGPSGRRQSVMVGGIKSNDQSLNGGNSGTVSFMKSSSQRFFNQNNNSLQTPTMGQNNVNQLQQQQQQQIVVGGSVETGFPGVVVPSPTALAGEGANFALSLQRLGSPNHSIESSLAGHKSHSVESREDPANTPPKDGGQAAQRAKSDMSFLGAVAEAAERGEQIGDLESDDAGLSVGQTTPGNLEDNNEEEKDDNDENNRVSLNVLIDDQLLLDSMPRCIIHPQAPWKTIWNIVMLFLIIFLSITVPYRIPFEDVTPPEWLYLDIVIDFLFIIDVGMNFFTAIEDDNGELVTSHKKISLSYAKSWFLIDVMSSIPISLIQKLSTPNTNSSSDQSGSSVLNVRIIKLSRLPRLYRLLRLLKLMRLYKSNKFIEMLTMQLNMSVTTSRLMKSFIMVFFLLHLVGCLWVTVAVLNPYDDPLNWQSASNLQDSDNFEIYICAVYWAAVSIYTVGYGDITSQNNFELFCNIIILFIGITMYTYIFSQLSALFSSVSQKDVESNSRERLIIEMAQAHQFPDELTKRLLFFFTQNSYLISLSKEYGIDQLLEILPPHLKGELAQFLYQEAIGTIQLLQDRDMRFYGDYMAKFEPMSIKTGTIFAKEGSSAQEIFFLMKGCVECVNQKKFYLEGTVFGECDVILKRPRFDCYKAISDCYILKIDKATFEQILDEFEDIRDDVQKMVLERERKRIEIYQQTKLKKIAGEPAEFAELKSIISNVNFDEIRKNNTSNFLKRTELQVKNSLANMSFMSGQDPEYAQYANEIKQSISMMRPIRLLSQSSLMLDTSNMAQDGNKRLSISPIGSSNYTRNGTIMNKIEQIKNNMQGTFLKTNTLGERLGTFKDTLGKGTLSDKRFSLGIGYSNREDSKLDESKQLSSHNYTQPRTSVINTMQGASPVDKMKQSRIQEGANGGISGLIPESKSLEEDFINKSLITDEISYDDSDRLQKEKLMKSAEKKEANGFTVQLRESLQKLNMSLHTEQEVLRNATQRDNPVKAGNGPSNQDGQGDMNPEDEPPSHSISADEESHIDKSQVFGLEEGAEEVKKLASNISLCMNSIANTKALIKEYQTLFEATAAMMGEDSNEIIKKNFSQGRNCLESYLSIISLIEQLVTNMDFPTVAGRLSQAHEQASAYEKRFYFLENRVKMVAEIVQRRLKTLEKQKQRLQVQKQVIVIKKNPLLDQRDERHNRQHQRLMDRSPLNF